MTTIVASRDGERIYYDAPETYFDLIQEIPGTRYAPKRRMFHAPLSWATCVASRGVLGDMLEWDAEMDEWTWEEKEMVADFLGAKCSLGMGRLDFRRSEGFVDPRLDDYQWVGANWLNTVERAVLGDKMRMGKTVQVLSALEHFNYNGPALIVCPNSTKLMWRDECAIWAPSRSVSVISGTKAQQEKAMLAEADIYVVSWDLMKKLTRHRPFGSVKLTDVEKTVGPLNFMDFAVTIFDEAHRMADPTSKQTRAAWYLAHHARYRWLLTGTLITDTPDDAWALMHAVAPEEYPVRGGFINRYCDTSPDYSAGKAPNGEWRAFKVKGLKAETKAEFFRFFDVRFLRRSKADDVTRLTLPVEMGAAQAKAYAQMERHMMAEFDSGILAATDPLTLRTRLLQMAAATPVLDEEGQVVELKAPSCKVDALLELVADNPGRPLVVFAESRKLIELCGRALTKAKVRYGMVTGKVASADRLCNVANFQEGRTDVILLTLGAGAEGLTLSRADTVVFLQRSYRQITNLQAAGRADAIRDEVKPVEIIDIRTVGTCEDRVHEIAGAKNSRLQEFLRDPKEWFV